MNCSINDGETWSDTPAPLLRAPDEATREAETRRFVEDLEMVARVMG